MSYDTAHELNSKTIFGKSKSDENNTVWLDVVL